MTAVGHALLRSGFLKGMVKGSNQKHDGKKSKHLEEGSDENPNLNPNENVLEDGRFTDSDFHRLCSDKYWQRHTLKDFKEDATANNNSLNF